MMTSLGRRLILVSNRLPFQLLEKGNKVTLKQSDGGLVTALKSYFEREGNKATYNEKIWFGSADFPQKRWQKFQQQKRVEGNFDIEPLFIDQKIYDKYYNGFCNATLWPLFHYFPSFVVYEQEYFENYERVNKQFADTLTAIIQPGDTIWIHDYQLFLLPGMIREKFPDATIGFFLHIPFPSFEIFRLLHRSWKEKIIKGMMGADLIGFHTHEYVQHFLKTVRMVAGYDHQYRVIPAGNRVVKADLFPLGIDYENFSTTAQRKEVVDQKDVIVQNFAGRKIIFSVDRLDYTKGVTHRLSGFERFLEMFPEWREKVVFILVVVPSRQIISKYNERRKMIEEQVGRINGKYSNLVWQPIIYRYSTLPFEELTTLYLAADVALITPLRDGMNLVAKEYVASCSDQKGVLILSELAGAASELSEALLVNPLDIDELAKTIEQALTMPPQEQEQRLSIMQKQLVENDVNAWVNDFLHQLQEVKTLQKDNGSKFITPEVQKEIIEAYKHARSRNVFMDYDGTLVGFSRHPRNATPDQKLLKLLATLGNDRDTHLTIISGRDAKTLNEWFKDSPVNLVAEHGASIKKFHEDWVEEGEIDQSWKPVIRPTFELFSKRCPGSFIEEKKHTLAWHYRNVEPELGFIRSRELLDNLYHLIRNAHLQILDGNKVIEVRVAGIDKGAAAKKLVESFPSEFILAVGDDKTDEDIFRAIGDRAFTIKVGAGHSQARYHVGNHEDVIQLLRALADSSHS
jgi:trehalose 6-phosphate synthase/phosphatase